jgi:hypothetical protein
VKFDHTTEVLRSFLLSQTINATTTSSAILRALRYSAHAFSFVVPRSSGGRFFKQLGIAAGLPEFRTKALSKSHAIFNHGCHLANKQVIAKLFPDIADYNPVLTTG